jgi:photosystem II cytochrome c550
MFDAMRYRGFFLRCLLVVLVACLWLISISSQPAQAAVDSYVVQYLQVTEPINLDLDGKGQTQQFSAADFSEGKVLFKQHCLTCHVGGNTLPNPKVSLSLTALAGATPPRNNINNLVAYFRQPMTYDGSEENLLCRQVSETWMPQQQVEKLAAFVLRAAEKAPGWATETFEP